MVGVLQFVQLSAVTLKEYLLTGEPGVAPPWGQSWVFWLLVPKSDDQSTQVAELQGTLEFCGALFCKATVGSQLVLPPCCPKLDWLTANTANVASRVAQRSVVTWIFPRRWAGSC